MSRLLMIRHAETAHNVKGRISTAAPGGTLSEVGFQQAERLGGKLAARSIEEIYTSPLVRARQTAEVIARHHNREPLVCDTLAEISAGELDGRGDPEAYEVLNEALDAWCRRDYSVRIGRDGDLGSEVCERFDRLVDEVVERHPSGTVALVSHGGLLQVGVASLAENLEAGFALRRFIRNTGIVELEAGPGSVHCVSWEGKPPADLTRS